VRLPEPGLQYLVDYLFEIGPTLPGMGGPVPLSFSEILAWQQLTGRYMQPWEVLMIRRLSLEYIGMKALAEDPACPEPTLEATPDVEEARAVTSSMRARLRGMAGK
jgi:hypothetical protein